MGCALNPPTSQGDNDTPTQRPTRSPGRDRGTLPALPPQPKDTMDKATRTQLTHFMLRAAASGDWHTANLFARELLLNRCKDCTCS